MRQLNRVFLALLLTTGCLFGGRACINAERFAKMESMQRELAAGYEAGVAAAAKIKELVGEITELKTQLAAGEVAPTEALSRLALLMPQLGAAKDEALGAMNSIRSSEATLKELRAEGTPWWQIALGMGLTFATGGAGGGVLAGLKWVKPLRMAAKSLVDDIHHARDAKETAEGLVGRLKQRNNPLINELAALKPPVRDKAEKSAA